MLSKFAEQCCRHTVLALLLLLLRCFVVCCHLQIEHGPTPLTIHLLLLLLLCVRRDTLVPLLSVLPLLGPSLYLVLRPKTYSSSDSS
jgi:hypothetical protein